MVRRKRSSWHSHWQKLHRRRSPTSKVTELPLGDPIEVAALSQAFRASTDTKGFCALGSVKSNIGHLDAAAGMAGLIKTALALKYKLLPPSLHFEKPNPKFDIENTPFYVNTKLTAWSTGKTPAAPGELFGTGGTNAAAVKKHLQLSPQVNPVTGSSYSSPQKRNCLRVSHSQPRPASVGESRM